MNDNDKEEVKQLLVALIASGPTPYYVENLLYDFKKEFGFNLPKFECKSSIDFLKSISDIIQLTGSHTMVQVQLIDNSKSAHISSLVKRQNLKKSKKKLSLQEAVVKPKYNTISYSTARYNQNKNSEITKNVKNIDSLHPLCNNNNLNQNLNTQLTIEKNEILSQREMAKKEGIGKKSTYNHKKSNKLKVNNVAANGLSKKVDQTGNVNMNVVTDIDDIPKLNLESYVTKGEYIEVCVTNIHTPHNFTVQLRKFKMQMKNFIRELQLFYNQDVKDYEIPKHLIKVDLVCVVFYKKNDECAGWHRSVILDLLDFSAVLVKLLDTGKIVEVKSKNLRFLHHQFAQFPVQALKGYLAYVEPYKDHDWSFDTNNRFRDLVLGKDLIAGVVNLNSKDLWLSVALSNTNGTEIHINDTLVEENLAKFEVDLNILACCERMHNNSAAHIHENQCPCTRNSSTPKNILKSHESESKKVIHEILKYTGNNIKIKELFNNALMSVISI